MICARCYFLRFWWPIHLRVMSLLPTTSSALAYARTLTFVVIGGALGTLLRAGFTAMLPPQEHLWPWNTFAVNILGSLLIGLILEAGEKLHAHIRAFHAVGFCGGLTTFSAFAVETVRLGQGGQGALAAAYVITSVIGCIIAVYAGFRLTGLWSGREPGRKA